jgi:hypothetical protein
MLKRSSHEDSGSGQRQHSELSDRAIDKSKWDDCEIDESFDIVDSPRVSGEVG